MAHRCFSANVEMVAIVPKDCVVGNSVQRGRACTGWEVEIEDNARTEAISVEVSNVSACDEVGKCRNGSTWAQQFVVGNSVHKISEGAWAWRGVPIERHRAREHFCQGVHRLCVEPGCGEVPDDRCRNISFPPFLVAMLRSRWNQGPTLVVLLSTAQLRQPSQLTRWFVGILAAERRRFSRVNLCGHFPPSCTGDGGASDGGKGVVSGKFSGAKHHQRRATGMKTIPETKQVVRTMRTFSPNREWLKWPKTRTQALKVLPLELIVSVV